LAHPRSNFLVPTPRMQGAGPAVFVPVMMMIRRDADPSTNHRVENQIYNCLSSFVSHDDLCHLLDHATAPVAGSSPIRSFRAARPMLSVPRSPARYAELAAPRRRENERQQRRIVITRRVGVERHWHSSAAFFILEKAGTVMLQSDFRWAPRAGWVVQATTTPDRKRQPSRRGEDVRP
jgi:hypothetical protein